MDSAKSSGISAKGICRIWIVQIRHDDPDEKAAEVNQFKIDYTTAQEKYSYRERYLKANQSILKSTIMLNLATKEMEDKLRDETDFLIIQSRF